MGDDADGCPALAPPKPLDPAKIGPTASYFGLPYYLLVLSTLTSDLSSHLQDCALFHPLIDCTIESLVFFYWFLHYYYSRHSLFYLLFYLFCARFFFYSFLLLTKLPEPTIGSSAQWRSSTTNHYNLFRSSSFYQPSSHGFISSFKFKLSLVCERQHHVYLKISNFCLMFVLLKL